MRHKTCTYTLDRTAELRMKGFEGRRLGNMQMTTDTAVRVTRMIIQDKSMLRPSPLDSARSPRPILRLTLTLLIFFSCFPVPLDQIKFVDTPEIKVSEHETVEMPFRYVVGDDGKPIMPQVSVGTFAMPWHHDVCCNVQTVANWLMNGPFRCRECWS